MSKGKIVAACLTALIPIGVLGGGITSVFIIEENIRVDNEITIPPKVDIVVEKEDGSIETTKPDGTVEVETPDGEITTTTPDGTVEVETPDGETTTTSPDGTVEVETPDGETTTTSPDGTVEVETPDGEITTTTPDGTIEVETPDGEVTTTTPDGTVEVVKPDGEVTTTTPDGTVEVVKPDGVIEVTHPDGTVDITLPDDQKLDHSISIDDLSIIVTGANGEGKIENQNISLPASIKLDSITPNNGSYSNGDVVKITVSIIDKNELVNGGATYTFDYVISGLLDIVYAPDKLFGVETGTNGEEFDSNKISVIETSSPVPLVEEGLVLRLAHAGAPIGYMINSDGEKEWGISAPPTSFFIMDEDGDDGMSNTTPFRIYLKDESATSIHFSSMTSVEAKRQIFEDMSTSIFEELANGNGDSSNPTTHIGKDGVDFSVDGIEFVIKLRENENTPAEFGVVPTNKLSSAGILLKGNWLAEGLTIESYSIGTYDWMYNGVSMGTVNLDQHHPFNDLYSWDMDTITEQEDYDSQLLLFKRNAEIHILNDITNDAQANYVVGAEI